MKTRINKLLKTSILLLVLLTNTSVYTGLYNPQTFTLKNGLQVVVLENNRAEVVSQSVWYKVGSVNDPHGKSGLAHYLEHMMFKGPDGSPSSRYDTDITRLGGQFNASTGADATNYYSIVATEHLEKIVQLESGRMRELSIVPQQAANELQVILQERNMRYENNPVGRFIEILNARFFYNHPYRLPSIGWEHEIRGLTASDVKEFYNKWYSPNNAILIFAGNITVQKARELAEKYYADIPAKKLSEQNYLQEPPHRDLIEKIFFKADEIQNPYFMRLYQGPNFKYENGKYTSALEVLKYILTVEPWGLWYDSFITQQKIATFVQINHSVFTRDANIFMVVMQPTDGQSLENLEVQFDKLLNKIKQEGISASAVERAKRQVIKQTNFTLDNVLGGADEFGSLMALGILPYEIDNWIEQIKAVKVEDVNEVLNIIFNREQHMNAYLMPIAPSHSPTTVPVTTKDILR